MKKKLMMVLVAGIFAFATGVAAQPLTRTEGTREPTAAEVKAAGEVHRNYEKKQKELAAGGPSVRAATSDSTSKKISVYVHIIKNKSGVGAVTTQQVNDQIAQLNSAFASTGYSFTLKATETTVNDAYFGMNPGTVEEKNAKAALRKGGKRDLNLYFANPKSVLGWATYPSDYTKNAQNDGVVLVYKVVKGGSGAPFNLGNVAVHEIGHWMGLFHTFQGGCSENNDLINDTPREKQAILGCPATAPATGCGGTSKASIDNFMAYTDDACMKKFTAGQASRIASQMTTYR